MDNEYVLLDTSAFDEAIAQKDRLIAEYRAINEEYGRIVRELLENWEGKGARAFREDAKDVGNNLSGIQEILGTMMLMLQECKEFFQQRDSQLGEHNANHN